MSGTVLNFIFETIQWPKQLGLCKTCYTQNSVGAAFIKKICILMKDFGMIDEVKLLPVIEGHKRAGEVTNELLKLAEGA